MSAWSVTVVLVHNEAVGGQDTVRLDNSVHLKKSKNLLADIKFESFISKGFW